MNQNLAGSGASTVFSAILGRWILAVATFAVPLTPLAAEHENVERGLIKIEHDWCRASINGDAAAISAILADDFTDVSLTGELVGKAEVLADVKAQKGAVCNIDMMQIRVYGSTAVVVGRTTWMLAGANGQYRYTDVYVRRGGGWRCVASQATEIKK